MTAQRKIVSIETMTRGCGKKNMTVSIDAEKAFDKIQYPFKI